MIKKIKFWLFQKYMLKCGNSCAITFDSCTKNQNTIEQLKTKN